MTSEGPRLAGEAALTLGGLRGDFECVHVYVWEWDMEQVGKMREESRNEHLVST